MKKTHFLAVTAALTTCVALAFTAQDPQEAGAPSGEAMARMAPGPMHAKLEPLIGTWKVTGKWRTAPDAAWESLEATAVRAWMLDKRFVREDVESEFMGQPFRGLGIIGHDNTRGEFTMVWVENMSTGTWLTRGQMRGSTLTFEGTNSDAMTGEKDRWGKSVIDISGDEQLYKAYAKDAQGKEFQSMELVFKRK